MTHTAYTRPATARATLTDHEARCMDALVQAAQFRGARTVAQGLDDALLRIAAKAPRATGGAAALVWNELMRAAYCRRNPADE